MSRQAEFDRELVRRRGFYQFAKLAWHIVEPSPYVDNWHIEEVCNHCQAITEHKIKDLCINQPPGTSKSLVVSVLWMPWAWTVRPELRWIFASFDPSLSLNHAEKSFKLLTSPWFIERWGNLLKPSGSYAMGEYDSAAGGFRFSTSVGGKGTGRHAHVRVADDPIKPLDVDGTTKAVSATLETTNNWWRNTMASRMADPSDFASVILMQRLHESDPSAECVRVDGYEHLCLPMRFETARASRTSVGGDRRTIEGELLDPKRYPEPAVAKLERSMGGRDGPVASAQLQQRPSPPGGLIFKEETFKYFRQENVPFDRSFSCLSVDCAFKDAESSSNVAIEVWGTTDAMMHCYDSVSENLGFSATLQTVELVLARFPDVNAILIEEKANGAAIIELMRKRFSNVVAILPKTSKMARAHAANVYYQAGSVYHLEGAPWLGRKETSLKHFPKGRRNDDVDTTSQAVLWLAEQSMADFSAAMQTFEKEQAGGEWSRHFGLG